MSLTEVQALPRPRDALGAFGIYVHVPFCAHRCWYCDFNAYAGLDHLADAYMEALVRDAREALSAPADADLAPRPVVTSVFIGGGTPSLVDARWIAELLEALRQSWDLAPDAEITIECNPESLTASKLDAYLAAGVNRV
ncbi:MAG: radical SAM protein, partial [Candidatus Binatia bacterium]